MLNLIRISNFQTEFKKNTSKSDFLKQKYLKMMKFYIKFINFMRILQ